MAMWCMASRQIMVTKIFFSNTLSLKIAKWDHDIMLSINYAIRSIRSEGDEIFSIKICPRMYKELINCINPGEMFMANIPILEDGVAYCGIPVFISDKIDGVVITGSGLHKNGILHSVSIKEKK